MKAKKASRQHSWIARLLALLAVTGRAYWQTIVTELLQLRRSALICFILLFFCLFFSLSAWLSVCGLLGYWIYLYTMSILWSLGAVVALNLFFIMLMGLCLRNRLRVLALPKTRESLGRIKRTINDI